jgi:hypothetical protein
MNRVATVTLTNPRGETKRVLADIDQDGKAELWSRPVDLDLAELAAWMGTTPRIVRMTVEELAARQAMDAPADDEDPPRSDTRTS